MTYSIKRLRTDGDYCLINLDGVESLDVFLREVNKGNRLWIDNVNVFATNRTAASYDGYVRFKCDIDPDSQTAQSVVFYGTEVTSLTSTIERVLCLPDCRQDRSIGFSGQTSETSYEDLIFTSTQLKHILCVHKSRSYTFWYINLSAEQSVELADKANLDGIWFCSISDNGQALVHWLEHHNRTRTLGSFSCQYYGAWDNVLTFLGRSTYPVFDQLVFDQFLVSNNPPHRYDLLVKANVKSIVLIINPFSFIHGECELLLEGLRNGRLKSPKLELRFDADSSDLDEKLELFETGLQGLFGAMSSVECNLKELRLEMETVRLGSTARVFEENLVDMLQANNSLETLGIDSLVEPLRFPSLGILNAAAEHPRLQTLVFVPPTSFDPPKLDPLNSFQVWLQNNISFKIRFDDWGHPDAKDRQGTWQDYIFFCRFVLLQQVEDERIRSHLLVTALENQHNSPQRIRFLLSGNREVFAK